MKGLWKRRPKTWILAACFLLLLLPLCCAEDEAGFPEDIPVHTIDRGKSTPVERAPKRSSSSSLSSRTPSHSRHRRQVFDGFRFSDIFRIFNSGALEGVDSVLRSTRNFDVFQCLERISCEMAAPLRNDGNSDHESEHGDGSTDQLTTNPGVIQTIQSPFFQPGFQPAGQFIQFPQAQFVQPAIQGFQQFPVAQTGFQQVVQPASQFVRPANQFVQAPQQFAQQSAQHFVQQPFPGQQAVQSFRHGFHPAQIGTGRNPADANIKRSDEHGNGHQERQNSPSFFDGYRNLMRRTRQRDTWVNRMINRFSGKRKKREAPNEKLEKKVLSRRRRGIMDTLQRLWGGKEFVGVLDRMMAGTDDSLYPYTRAALMGYTGNTETCEQLYPECPTSMDELIDTFNNLRSYFPNGVPFRDRIPAPLRYLIP